MGIRFVYDEKDIKDIKVLFIGEEDKDSGDDFKETFKIFCIDSLPKNLEVKSTELDNGFLIESVNGEETLTKMMRFLYLIIEFVKTYSTEIASEDFNIEDLSLEKLQPEIDRVSKLDYTELVELLGADVEHDNF